MPAAALATEALVALVGQDQQELVRVTVFWLGLGSFGGALVVMWLYSLRQAKPPKQSGRR